MQIYMTISSSDGCCQEMDITTMMTTTGFYWFKASLFPQSLNGVLILGVTREGRTTCQSHVVSL